MKKARYSPQCNKRLRGLLAALAALTLIQCGEPNQPGDETERGELAVRRFGVIRLSDGNGENLDLSDQGVSVGWVGALIPRAFRWAKGQAVQLEGLSPSAPYDVAYGINEAGFVVGSSPAPGSGIHATLWLPSGLANDLGTLPGGVFSYADDINENGTIVGAGYNSQQSYTRPIMWSPGSGAQDLGTPPDLSWYQGTGFGGAIAINDLGDAAGWAWPDSQFQGHAVVWLHTGSILDLGGGQAADLNNSGVVVGAGFAPSTGLQSAFRWSHSGGMQFFLDGLDNGFSAATGINDQGLIVGYYMALIPPDNRAFHAFSWSSAGGLVDLGPAGPETSVARSVNSCGQIGGSAAARFITHPVVWPHNCGGGH